MLGLRLLAVFQPWHGGGRRVWVWDGLGVYRFVWVWGWGFVWVWGCRGLGVGFTGSGFKGWVWGSGLLVSGSGF